MAAKSKILILGLLFLAVIGVALLVKHFENLRFSSTQYQKEFTDQEILDTLSPEYKAPSDFFKDTLERDNIHYVRKPDSYDFYCTNDFKDAEQVAKYDSVMSLIETGENEKFFEFRVAEKSTNRYLGYRVLKCSYIEDLHSYATNDPKSNYYIGRFAQRPITKEGVKELAEFLWYSVYGVRERILSSPSKEQRNSITHTIYGVSSAYLKDGCPPAILTEYEFSLDKESGEVVLSQENIRSVDRCF